MKTHNSVHTYFHAYGVSAIVIVWTTKFTVPGRRVAAVTTNRGRAATPLGEPGQILQTENA